MPYLHGTVHSTILTAILEVPRLPDELPCLQTKRRPPLPSAKRGGLRFEHAGSVPVEMPGLPGEILRAVNVAERFVPRALSDLWECGAQADCPRTRGYAAGIPVGPDSYPGLSLRTLPSQVLFDPAFASDGTGPTFSCRLVLSQRISVLQTSTARIQSLCPGESCRGRP